MKVAYLSSAYLAPIEYYSKLLKVRRENWHFLFLP